jgi:serine/threonine protein kinase
MDDLANTIAAFEHQTRDPADAGTLPTGHARYREGRAIGRGGMGRVVEATDLQFGRVVALKTMLGGGEAGERVQRFGLEAIVTANLDHPGIPAVYERGRDGAGNPYYAMRLVRGRSLAQAIAQTRTLDDRLRLLPALIGVAQTLAFAHARGVIHRDIKPDNVVVGPYGDTVVIDWGVAKLRDVELPARAGAGERPLAQAVAATTGSTATRDGAVIGTPAYMAPEQAAGRVEAIDERSDVFSLGALLYHLFAGHPPYRGKSSLEALTQALEAEFRPLPELVPDLPPALAEIIARAMAKQPEQRYPSAGALAEALQELLARGVRSSDSRAVRLFASGTSLVLTIVMLVLVVALLGSISLLDLGVFGLLMLPTFTIGTLLSAIEWWTIGKYRLSPLMLGLAVVTGLEGLVTAAIGRAEIGGALQLAAEQGSLREPVEFATAYLTGTSIVGVAEIVGMQLCAAQIVLYAVARHRIATRDSQQTR